jgi:hypothetical protein
MMTMKIFRLFIGIVATGIVFTGCKKDPEIELVSLNKIGEEHYFGEKVLMWASTEGDKKGMTYSWKATGGTFEGSRTQNLFENVWIAPTQVGEFEVSSTAINGKSSSTRTTKMNVTRYFFDHFQSPNIFNGNGWPGWLQTNATSTLLNTDNKLNSNLQIVSSRVNSSNIDVNVRKVLNLADLKIPFSIRAKMGFRTYFKPGAPFTISLTFRQPRANPERPFIREIRWEIFPSPTSTTAANFQIRYEVYTPSKNLSVFSTNTGVYPAATPLINPVTGRNNTFFAMTSALAKNFTFSIEADETFVAHVDGVEWFRSSGIKDWLTAARAQYPGFEVPVANEFRILMPGKATTALPASQLFINSVYINNDGTILNSPI